MTIKGINPARAAPFGRRSSCLPCERNCSQKNLRRGLAASRTSARCNGEPAYTEFCEIYYERFKKHHESQAPHNLCLRPRAWSVALSSSRGACEDSSLTISLGCAREVDEIAPPDRRELECGPLGSTQARRARSDRTTPRVGLGERAGRRVGI